MRHNYNHRLGSMQWAVRQSDDEPGQPLKSRHTHHDLTHQGQDKLDDAAPTGLGFGLLGDLALRCAAFSKCCATLGQTSRHTDSKAMWGSIFRSILASVYMVMVCALGIIESSYAWGVFIGRSLRVPMHGVSSQTYIHNSPAAPE